MKPTAPKRTWDVLIVAGPGLATDHAYALHGQLARRDLRVKLDIASRPSASAFPAGIPEDAAEAGCCVVLATKGDKVKYAMAPVPPRPGPPPRFVREEPFAGPADVEIGVITDDGRSRGADRGEGSSAAGVTRAGVRSRRRRQSVRRTAAGERQTPWLVRAR